MGKRQDGRRPVDKPAGQGSGPSRPDRPDRGGKGFGKPEGHPIDKQMPDPGTRAGGKDILESERSDRESGRPVQLDDDDEREVGSGGGDADPGLGGRPREGGEGR
jgi:hypothetical protein